MDDHALPLASLEQGAAASLHSRLLSVLVAGLGDLAPTPGSPRYNQAYVDMAVIVENAREDKKRFLSNDLRDAILSAIAIEQAADRDFVGDVVRDGFHGYGLASDAELLELANELDIENILCNVDLGARNRSTHTELLCELASPQAVEVISAGAFDPAEPEAMLLGSLSKALSDHGLEDPYEDLTNPLGLRRSPQKLCAAVRVPDYSSAAPAPAPAPRKDGSGTGEPAMVTYWLYHGDRLLGSKRLRAGLGAVEVRAAAAHDAPILCDRPYESPANMRARLLTADVVVYDDRPAQIEARRNLPFELRALFPGEQPFYELLVRKPTGPAATLPIASAIDALQAVAAEHAVNFSVKRSSSAVARLVRVEQASGASLHKCAEAMKILLDSVDMEVVSEFGVGYRREATPGDDLEESVENEPERPRGYPPPETSARPQIAL